jgi:hypothetical protein
MDHFSTWFVLASTIVALAVFCIFFAWNVLRYRALYEQVNERRQSGALEDLELATTDQLLEELRKRSGTPYLLLMPQETEYYQGLQMEVHNLAPLPCLAMLQLAAAMTSRELKSRGIDLSDLPKFPPIDDEIQ